MQSYSILIFLTFVLALSCKSSTTNCRNANLTNNITVLGFPISVDIEDFSISIHQIEGNKAIREIAVKTAYFSEDQWNYLNIELQEDLFANNTYHLRLNDTLTYKISEIKTFSEVIMIGSREDSVCTTQSFKINDRMAESFFTTGINFKIPTKPSPEEIR